MNRPGARSRHAGNVSSSIPGIASSFGEPAEATEPDEPAAAPKDDPTPPAPVVATNVHEASKPDGREATVQAQPLSTILPSVGVASSSSKYILPTVTSPPELRLPQEEIDGDRAKARAAAAARGESKRSEAMAEWEEWGEGADEDEDANGFRNTSAGAKSRKKVSKRVNLACKCEIYADETSSVLHKKTKRKRGQSPSAGVNWDADYDPQMPNDYGAWKDVVRDRRQAVRRMEEQRRHRNDYDDRSWGRSGANDNRWSDRRYREDDEEEKLYLSPPPQSYDPPSSVLQPPQPESSSRQPAPATGEEAYQRRQAMSGEEAYQRRLAMSQSAAGGQPPPPQPQGAGSEFPPARSPGAPPGPPPAFVDRTVISDDASARQSAAAAIAARLAKSAPAREETSGHADPSDSTPAGGSGDFAERLMAKWGHVAGQGLGAEGNQGRTEALVMEKVGGNDGAHKRRNFQRDEWGETVASGATNSSMARGRYVGKDPRAEADLERYGQPSEVVLLQDMIASQEDIDDSLPEEISAECSRHGIVERVAIVPPTRIFVIFTGMAGAWKCVRELDGRFFAGRKVKASYYSRRAFESGDRWR